MDVREYLVLQLAETERVPQTLSYRQGVREVRYRLYAKYGADEFDHALSTVCDLIEDRQNAQKSVDEAEMFVI